MRGRKHSRYSSFPIEASRRIASSILHQRHGRSGTTLRFVIIPEANINRRFDTDRHPKNKEGRKKGALLALCSGQEMISFLSFLDVAPGPVTPHDAMQILHMYLSTKYVCRLSATSIYQNQGACP